VILLVIRWLPKISRTDTRDSKSILNDFHRLQVVDFYYESWHKIFSARKIKTEQGIKYCPVDNILIIPISAEEVQLLFDAYDPDKFNRNILGNLAKRIDDILSEK